VAPARVLWLQPAGADQGGQAVGVLAVPVAREAHALARAAFGADVDVVLRRFALGADLLDEEAQAEFRRDTGEEVALFLLAAGALLGDDGDRVAAFVAIQSGTASRMKRFGLRGLRVGLRLAMMDIAFTPQK
jgi:hypothetical protein